MDRSSKQKISKETQALNDTTDQIDLIDIYRTFHPKTADYAFFSGAHGTFSDVNCSNIFLCQSPKAIEIQAKINKWDLMKLKRFCIAKETINKMKSQPSAWEKIFANKSMDKGLIS